VPYLDLSQYDYLYALEQLANDYFSSIGISSGAVMGKINEFPFAMHENEFKKITETYSADFTSYQPIKGQEVLGMAISYKRDTVLNGVMIAQPINSTEPLEWFLKIGKPIRFTTLDTDMDAVITKLIKNKENFYINGEHRLETYSIILKEVYSELS
jgi:hypothetical protein